MTMLHNLLSLYALPGLKDFPLIIAIGALKPAMRPSSAPISAGAGIGTLPPNSSEFAVTVPNVMRRAC